jgi:hypothetical protein
MGSAAVFYGPEERLCENMSKNIPLFEGVKGEDRIKYNFLPLSLPPKGGI